MCELGYTTTPEEMHLRLKSILPNSAYKTLVAIIEDRICGIIGTFIYSSYEHNDFSGRIVTLVIAKTLRRYGIGRALIEAAEKDFAQRGISRIAVNTRLVRKAAHRFYQALGYERNGYRFVKMLSNGRRCLF